MSQVLLDTSAIYALMVDRDRQHTRSRTYLARAIDRGVRFVLPDIVFAETMTLIRTRWGAQVSIQVGRSLRGSAGHTWERLSAGDERAAWDVFQRFDDKTWSFTDCCILSIAQRLRITEVFSFDTRFDQMPGLVRVPGRATH